MRLEELGSLPDESGTSPYSSPGHRPVGAGANGSDAMDADRMSTAGGEMYRRATSFKADVQYKPADQRGYLGMVEFNPTDLPLLAKNLIMGPFVTSNNSFLIRRIHILRISEKCNLIHFSLA